ncbi:hypothetical protein FDP41_011161 [Naegleria fowleri]|uniref:SAM-dependent methyltransferase Erg6/SMT-type domain-containing protein n=1 Tax=Naegleria fowleri TaxID=5763 RepID=A0A6A5BYH4_NAEFO|nr:uncharacterized protein FDP41_011161 [Naegleria fowleri]KAF0983183.1 hypothetical protein FDP41_011161 [Naegleria fowleri]CAG4718219.1 unnamed protein product [Naegleria fowleri]
MLLLLATTAIIGGFVLYLFKFREQIGRSHLTDTDKTGSYHELFATDNEQTHQKRKQAGWDVAGKYYDMVTDFYLYGWGRSFHFAPRHSRESLNESIQRHEYWLAKELGLKAGMKCLDMGCGVMGPAVNISRFSGAHVTGVNNHPYQSKRAAEFIVQMGMEDQCKIVRGDFNNLDDNKDLPAASYDAAYAIEATCHAKDRAHCYRQIFNKLKPGAVFGGYEWVMLTGKYDPKNEQHNKIKFDIMKGDGLPELLMDKDIDQALRDAGFEVIKTQDVAITDKVNPIPWYQPLDNGGWEFTNWFQTAYGRWVVHKLVGILEKVGLVPKTSQQAYEFLMAGADGLVGGGKTGIFTPSYFFLARKPLN